MLGQTCDQVKKRTREAEREREVTIETKVKKIHNITHVILEHAKIQQVKPQKKVLYKTYKQDTGN